MKKLLCTIVLVITALTANAQDGQFNLGINGGLPIGDFDKTHSFTLGAEVNYLFEVAENFKVGPSVAFINYFGKEENNIGFGDIQFLPVSAAARYNLSEKFSFGADLGYGIGINNGNDGGFYYRPLISYAISEKMAIQGSYSGISKNGNTISNIGIGVSFSL
ncbi:outer membrane beta-barrel protein [uncultured Tenacibaculum sp.]|uniref:outer membrane beta-barrel protein n=1 Tax=uncultured Tenacibaculum sp. TaxID=174713 RepID=UPI0026213B9D|nr:outer membrane beta-barrel protein [uncultured Tenacibaculum sp.]